MSKKLKVDWITAIRVGPERTKVEDEYKRLLLQHFHDVSGIDRSRQEYYRSYQSPKSEWYIANKEITQKVVDTTDMLPTEKNNQSFVIKVLDNHGI